MSENQSKSLNREIDDNHEEQGEKSGKNVPGDTVPGEAQNDLNNTKLESESEIKQMETLGKEISSLNINEKPRFVARLRGLPWSAREKEVKEFFKDEKILEIQVVFSPDGKASGEAFVEFESLNDFQNAYSKNKQNLGHRYIEIFKATGNDIDVASGRTSRASCVSPKTQYIVRMRGLPYEATENDVNKFFSGLNIVAVHLIKDDLSRPSGEGFVEFASEDDVSSAMTKHRHNIGRRYIELFRSGRDDLTKMLGLSQRGHIFGRKHFPPQKYNYRKNNQQRNDINSSCLLMRGLPYSCSETDITKFFQEIDVTPVRIHRKADGAEAYVEFCSNTDCTKAMTRHKSYIGSRYIELFRVTYEDMAQTVGLSMPQQRSFVPSNATNFQQVQRNANSIPQNLSFMPNFSQTRTQQASLPTQNARSQQFYNQLLTHYPLQTDTGNSSLLNESGRRVPPTFFR